MRSSRLTRMHRMRIAHVISALLSRIGPMEADECYRALYLADLLLSRARNPHPTGLTYNIKQGRLVAPLLQLHVFWRAIHAPLGAMPGLLLPSVSVVYHTGHTVMDDEETKWEDTSPFVAPREYGVLEQVIRESRAGRISSEVLDFYDGGFVRRALEIPKHRGALHLPV